VVFIGGLEGLFFNLFPVSFLDGSYVWGWSKWRWVVVMGLSAFLYWEILLNKAGAYDDVLNPTSGPTFAIVVTICVVLAGGAWLYFKTRPEEEELEPGT
jgi:hypothetical protein